MLPSPSSYAASYQPLDWLSRLLSQMTAVAMNALGVLDTGGNEEASSVVSLNHLYTDGRGPSLLDNSQYIPKVENLVVGYSVAQLYDLLAHVESLSVSLRCLSIINTADPDTHGPKLKLISAAAPVLEHLYLGDLRPGTFVILPALPSLHSVSFDRHWALDTVLSVIETSPLLTEIIICLTSYRRISSRIPQSLTTLDAAVAVRPRRLVIRWRPDLARHESAQEMKFAELATKIHTRMPKTVERGRIVLEKYNHAQELTRWLTGIAPPIQT
ncbi:hypothetical protein C8R45DRAFT_1110520 [Mycena sanguinolenta]|nr:hypothetical protein C8R45DRAFT_1110520 [Mycena sanguinolenta]